MAEEFDFTTYQALSFDIYTTLIDWEAGIFTELARLLSRVPESNPIWQKSLSEVKSHLILRYSKHEHTLEMENPKEKYPIILVGVYERLATELEVNVTREDALAFGQAIGTWPAFADTVAAMQSLGKRYKLVALSNVDKASFG